MKALAILGTSSNAGKSWMTTAFCAALLRRGIRAAPFKAQNMSNNSYVTLDGGEMGRAQAVQAEACGLDPRVEMNPILLKPSGLAGSQLIVLGRALEHLKAQEYYRRIEDLWPIVRDTLEDWKSRCDVLVMEGAGSPVELNLMHRDIVNLRPVEHLGGRWLLVSNIERGGVFAQIVGTWNLLPPAARERGLGAIVNQFRGDKTLFADAARCLALHTPLPYLGVVPHRAALQPESEDSLCDAAESSKQADGNVIAWIRFPHLSNSQDAQPWLLDRGVSTRWARAPEGLADAKAIILPGSKNTLADLAWLHETGLARVIRDAAGVGIPVLGICGGYQMLGHALSDADGVAGQRGEANGLGLLPVATEFFATKTVQQVTARWRDDRWTAYEIHMGKTTGKTSPLLRTEIEGRAMDEGCRRGNVWGTYLHGFFESRAVREDFARAAGLQGHTASQISWKAHQQTIYGRMADLIEEHLDLDAVWKYVED